MEESPDKIALKAVMNIEFIAGKDLVQNRRILLKYSGHFNNYSANVRYTKNYIQFNLSRLWKDVDAEIQMGIIESLTTKMFKIKMSSTDSMKLYENFMKGLSKYAKKHIYDPQLSISFDRVNSKFFDNSMEKPNLVFANESFRKLGSYEYGTDTIYMSTIFKDLPESEQKYLDYVIYHELLHKKHTFNVKNGRHQAHTTAFRKDEAKFSEDLEIDMEKELGVWLRKKKYGVKRLFKLW